MSETRGFLGPIAWGSEEQMECLCGSCRLHRILPAEQAQTFIEYHSGCSTVVEA